MRARLGRLTRIEGRTESGGSVSTWAAYFRRDSLTWLRETVQLQDYVPRANEYFWAGGRLRTFLSSGAVSWTGKARERGPFTMAIAFDDSGRVVASRKKVNDVDAAIEPYEAAGALGRGEWLGALARQKRAVPGR